MKSKVILITRPKMNDDLPTNHTYYWANPLIQHATNLDYQILDYKMDYAEYEKVNTALENYRPDVYIHFGHGCPSNLIGQQKCILTNGNISSNSNENENETKEDIVCDRKCTFPSNVHFLSNKIVIAYACQSSKKLGKCAMKNGAKAYIGFNDYLIFMTDTKETEDIFKDCMLSFSYSLLNGDTLEKAKEKTLYMFDIYIKYYKKYKYVSKLLLWDREAFTVYGNDNLTIFNK